MILVLILIVSILVIGLAGCDELPEKKVNRAAIEPGQHSLIFNKIIKEEMNLKYLLFLPESYGKTQQKWPLILFLHGLGECGDNLELIKKHGLPKIVKTKKDFPFVVVSPQCPKGQWWPDKIEVLIKLLDDIGSSYDIDTDRVYLTGLSMGGYGSWTLACAYPERFAAVVPICGGGVHHLGYKMRNVPVWAFHGAEDPVVPAIESRKMVGAIKKYGGNAKLTVYPGLKHDSWTVTYENPRLYEWLLEHTKKKNNLGR